MPSPARNTRAVEVIGVSKRYGYVSALQSVSLEIDRAECISLRGSNGAGKTTLLKIIATHTSPSSGRVKIFSEDIGNNDGAIRRKIGLVTHDCYLYNELTIQENLQFFAHFFMGDKKTIPSALIDLLGLERWYNVRVNQLSHGLRKRADIARALLHDPDVILLDEPFTGLDTSACETLVRFFEEQRERQKTFVLSSHSGEWIQTICTREIVLDQGKIVDENRIGRRGGHGL